MSVAEEYMSIGDKLTAMNWYYTYKGGVYYIFDECDNGKASAKDVTELSSIVDGYYKEHIANNDKPVDNMIEIISYIQKYISEKEWSIQYAFHPDNNYYWYVYDSEGNEVIVEKSIEDVADAMARMRYIDAFESTVTEDPVEVANELSVNILADKLAALALTVAKMNNKLAAIDCEDVPSLKESVKRHEDRLETVTRRLDAAASLIDNNYNDHGELRNKIKETNKRIAIAENKAIAHEETIAAIEKHQVAIDNDLADISPEDIDNIKETLAEHNELLSKILDALEVDRDKLNKLIKDDALTDEFVAEQWYGINEPISDITDNLKEMNNRGEI